MSECMKKGMTHCEKITEKKVQKTDEKTQRPMPVNEKASGNGKSWTIKR